MRDIEKGDVIYHVTTATHNSRYSEKVLFFNDGAIGKPVNLDFDEEIFVMQTIAKIIAENKYKVLAYNFCKDHLHFLVACKKEELPKIMQKIKGITSLERNRKFNPTDRQLWQQKYFEKVVYNDEYLENTIHYILNNRKKHGLKEFTDDELCILRNIDKKYKWIARDKSGSLCIFDKKPKKSEEMWDNVTYSDFIA